MAKTASTAKGAATIMAVRKVSDGSRASGVISVTSKLTILLLTL